MLLYVPIIVRDPELLKSFLQSLTQDACPHPLVFAEVFGSHQEPYASPLFNLILCPPPQPGPVHPPLNAKTFFQVECILPGTSQVHTRGRPWEHREEDRTLGTEEAKEQKGQTLKDYLYGNNKEHPGDCERTETRRGSGW